MNDQSRTPTNMSGILTFGLFSRHSDRVHGSRPRWHRWIIAGCVLLAGTFGCHLSEDELSTHIPGDQVLSTLAFEHRAYNLATDAPYDTVQLRVTAKMLDGSPAEGIIAYSTKSSAIEVAPDGLLMAKSATTRAVVYASLTIGDVTQTDSVEVSVVQGTPTLIRQFSFQLNPGDSAKQTIRDQRGATAAKAIPLYIEGTNGSQLSDLRIAVKTSNALTTKASISGNTVRVTPVRPGRSTVYASAYAYGVAYHDSIPFVVGWPLHSQLGSYERTPSGTLHSILDFNIGTKTVAAGACVTWWNQSYKHDLDIVFDDSLLVKSPPAGWSCTTLSKYDTLPGNIRPYRNTLSPEGRIDIYSSIRARYFPTAGVYHYRSIINGTSATLIVCDEANDTTCAPLRDKWY